MTQGSRIVIGALSVLGGLGACYRNGEREQGRTAQDTAAIEAEQSQARSETQSASSRIAQARCRLEARCENVGIDKKYSSTEACEREIRSEAASELNERECPTGVVEKELQDCLAAIQAEECGEVMDSLSRVVECRPRQMCAG